MHAEETRAVGPGEQIGPYTVLTELASGGMGRVYLARSPGGRTVAVKTLLSTSGQALDGGDGGDRRRFAREVVLARRVQGLFTVSVVDADADAAVPWMATEYIPAPSLGQLVASQGVLPPAALPWIAAGMAEALVSIHDAGLVHRDLKPSNVLLPEDGPRVIDFGISQAADVTRTKAALGTIAFTAPEQARGEPTTAASDVFSLGATLFHLVVGRSPYSGMGEGTAMEQLVRAANGLLDLEALPAEARDLVLPCLATEPERRPSPHDLLARVGTVLAERPQARGATDWLPPAWSTAIEQHRVRRTEEAEAARQRIDPHAVTERAWHAAGTRPAPPPAAAPAPRARRATAWVAASAAAGLIAVGGAVYAWQQNDEDGGAPAPVRQDLRLALVEEGAAGECTDKLAPPTFYAENTKSCYRISTRSADRMSVKQLQKVDAVLSDSTSRWVIQWTFEKDDGKRFADLSAKAAGRSSPQNQIAIVLGDRLISAPAVTSAISGGELEIAGDFTEASAKSLAKDLGAR